MVTPKIVENKENFNFSAAWDRLDIVFHYTPETGEANK